MNVILLVILIIAIFGGGSYYVGPAYGWGYGGGIGLIGLILIVLLFTGVLGRF